MNRVDIVGYLDGESVFYESYVDLSQVISIRQLTDTDKARRQLEDFDDLVHLVVRFEFDKNSQVPLQNPIGWIVPGNIHVWAELVREAKRQARNQ